MKEINERLTQLKALVREKERLAAALSKVVEQKNKAEDNKRLLYRQLEKERIDVEKLEGTTLSGFLQGLLGKKEERLEKERNEYIAAKLKFDTAEAEAEGLYREIEEIRARIAEIGDVEEEYKRLITEKEKVLMNSSGDFREALDRIMEEESRLISDNREISEAIRAGEELLYSLNRVQNSLDSAGGWGAWDILGGGLIATMAKHANIDEAQREINKVQALMNRFHRELGDIGGETDLDIEIGSFLTFADYFFDGLFADLAVQSRIREGQRKAEQAIIKVGIVIRSLNERHNQNNEKIISLKNQRASIIENA
ncbi:MAG TPA: hypothetical protein PK684_06120 [Bacillota bacterium]|jgi:DNA repair exonuclease SbcCD ATPase subunit|nr:hypothetical protein [Bacillota bacterium]